MVVAAASTLISGFLYGRSAHSGAIVVMTDCEMVRNDDYDGSNIFARELRVIYSTDGAGQFNNDLISFIVQSICIHCVIDGWCVDCGALCLLVINVIRFVTRRWRERF
jgi:hypothetical protein